MKIETSQVNPVKLRVSQTRRTLIDIIENPETKQLKLLPLASILPSSKKTKRRVTWNSKKLNIPTVIRKATILTSIPIKSQKTTVSYGNLCVGHCS